MSSGWHHTLESRKKISENNANYWFGKNRTSDDRQKISEKRKGKNINESNHNWKGNNASYVAKHAWVARRLGRPTLCENCNFTSDNTYQFHWSNISGEYIRDLSDWVRLCVRCHKLIDAGSLRWSKV